MVLPLPMSRDNDFFFEFSIENRQKETKKEIKNRILSSGTSTQSGTAGQKLSTITPLPPPVHCCHNIYNVEYYIFVTKNEKIIRYLPYLVFSLDVASFKVPIAVSVTFQQG